MMMNDGAFRQDPDTIATHHHHPKHGRHVRTVTTQGCIGCETTDNNQGADVGGAESSGGKT